MKNLKEFAINEKKKLFTLTKDELAFAQLKYSLKVFSSEKKPKIPVPAAIIVSLAVGAITLNPVAFAATAGASLVAAPVLTKFLRKRDDEMSPVYFEILDDTEKELGLREKVDENFYLKMTKNMNFDHMLQIADGNFDKMRDLIYSRYVSEKETYDELKTEKDVKYIFYNEKEMSDEQIFDDLNSEINHVYASLARAASIHAFSEEAVIIEEMDNGEYTLEDLDREIQEMRDKLDEDCEDKEISHNKGNDKTEHIV